MTVPGLSVQFVHDHAAEGSFDRGLNYQRSGAVVSLKRTSDATIDALVKGSQYAPYSVRIRHSPHEITSVECSCPYFAGAWCKHVVAALLACLAAEENEGPSGSASELVEHLSSEDVGALLDRVVGKHPEVLGWLRTEIREL
jgi:uncharacterized Zn finger protein